VYWNCSILMNKTVLFNQPDITFINKKTNCTFLMSQIHIISPKQ
jgi:hypothetical protein